MLAPALPKIDINDGPQYTQFNETVSALLVSLGGGWWKHEKFRIRLEVA